jgi:hypothetical protein
MHAATMSKEYPAFSDPDCLLAGLVLAAPETGQDVAPVPSAGERASGLV